MHDFLFANNGFGKLRYRAMLGLQCAEPNFLNKKKKKSLWDLKKRFKKNGKNGKNEKEMEK